MHLLNISVVAYLVAITFIAGTTTPLSNLVPIFGFIFSPGVCAITIPTHYLSKERIHFRPLTISVVFMRFNICIDDFLRDLAKLGKTFLFYYCIDMLHHNMPTAAYELYNDDYMVTADDLFKPYQFFEQYKYADPGTPKQQKANYEKMNKLLGIYHILLSSKTFFNFVFNHCDRHNIINSQKSYFCFQF